ncbi:hypothetical protein KI387_022087, partial [Taxus chinensis]
INRRRLDKIGVDWRQISQSGTMRQDSGIGRGMWSAGCAEVGETLEQSHQMTDG